MNKEQSPVKKTLKLLKTLDGNALELAEWIIEHHDKAKNVERTRHEFKFEFEVGEERLYFAFWIANEARWLQLEVNELKLEMFDPAEQERLWWQLEELAEVYSIYAM
jgi:hypothetical protein